MTPNSPISPSCARCGARLGPGAFFCPRCGTSIPVPTGSAAPTLATSTVDAERMSSVSNAQLEALRRATLGEYEILLELGHGGMATVYPAHDLALDPKVATKARSPALFPLGEGRREGFKA